MNFKSKRLFLALVIDLMLIMLVGQHVWQIYNPAPQREVSPLIYQADATPIPGCVPLPTSSSVINLPLVSLTPTIENVRNNRSLLSATPLPAIKKIDLAPGTPENLKSTVMVYQCKGSFVEYLIGPGLDLSVLPLYHGDVIFLIVPPVKLTTPTSQ